MNFDTLNILTIISCILIVYTVFMMFRDKRVTKLKVDMTSQKVEEALSDYDKVVKRTAGIERERQKNTGQHHDDESFYLNRAEVIRSKTNFFSFVNGN